MKPQKIPLVVDGNRINVSLYKRGEAYHYSFSFKKQRYRCSAGVDSEDDAIRVINEQVPELLKTAQIKSSGDILLSDAWKVFRGIPKEAKTGKIQAKHVKAQWDDLLCYLADLHPEIQTVSGITPRIAGEYIRHVRQHGKYNKQIVYSRGGKTIKYENKTTGAADKTQNDYLATGKMICNYLCQQIGVENPFEGIAKIKRPHKAKREVYTLGELKQIWQASRDSYLFPIFFVGAFTAMREGNICMLEPKDIMFELNLISIENRKTKTSSVIPIMPPLREYLETLTIKGQYVFPELSTQYQKDATKISKDIKKVLSSLEINATREIEGRTRKASTKDAHSLRHTFVYLAAMHNVPLPIVQSILGHMSPEMTKMYMDHAGGDASKHKYFKGMSEAMAVKGLF
jgi:integrase